MAHISSISASDHGIMYEVPVYNNDNVNVSDLIRVEISEEKIDNLKKLEVIASLPDDWNANGAKSISDELIRKMRDFLLFLEIQPEIFPTAYGSLQMEYDKMDGSHLEIELTEDKYAEVFKVDPTGSESLMEIEAKVEEINRLVSDFYG